MIANLRLIPNQLTAIRFLAVPVMWVFAFMGELRWIGIGLFICLVTDLLDGMLARRLNQVSTFGSKFDSIADQFLQLSALGWVIMLMPEIFSENLILSLLAIATYLLSLAVGLVKFKRIANLHLILSKVGGLFLYIFLIHAFYTGTYSQVLFILAATSFILSSAETLALQLTSEHVDAEMGTILFRFFKDDHPFHRWLKWFSKF